MCPCKERSVQIIESEQTRIRNKLLKKNNNKTIDKGKKDGDENRGLILEN